MKNLFFVAAASAALFSSCGVGSASLKTEADSLAYVSGLQCGMYVKNVDSTMNLNVVYAAIKDVVDNKPKIDQEAAMAFMREYFMVRKPARNKIASEKFLEKVEKENKETKKTPSGLLYEIVQAGGEQKAVSDSDVVRVVYEGRIREGKVFDSSIQRGDTAEFALNRVIKGWGEGMKLVGKGGKIKLWIPSDLAYGEQGIPQAGIEPNEALMFDVQLIDVIPADSVKVRADRQAAAAKAAAAKAKSDVKKK